MHVMSCWHQHAPLHIKGKYAHSFSWLCAKSEGEWVRVGSPVSFVPASWNPASHQSATSLTDRSRHFTPLLFTRHFWHSGSSTLISPLIIALISTAQQTLNNAKSAQTKRTTQHTKYFSFYYISTSSFSCLLLHSPPPIPGNYSAHQFGCPVAS